MSDAPSGSAPILEFDPSPTAIIEPTAWFGPMDGIPRHGVLTWMPDAMERLLATYPHTVRRQFGVESSQASMIEVDLDGSPILAALSPVGAPQAGALLEAMIGVGCTTFTAVGSSGGLLAEHPPGMVVIPDAVIRDEGTSYHYAPPARHAYPDAGMQTALRSAFADAGVAAITGDVWTTDAIFRETAAKVAARVAEGAVAVDMEASAFATIAAFRRVRLGHAVYLADTLHSDEWDPTELVERDTDFRFKLLLTAAQACLAN